MNIAHPEINEWDLQLIHVIYNPSAIHALPPVWLLDYVLIDTSRTETNIRITPDAVAEEKGRYQTQYYSVCHNLL